MAMDKRYEQWLAATLKNEYQDILATEDCFDTAFTEDNMRYFSFTNSHGDTEVWSESDVRREYWPQWYEAMCVLHEQAYVDEHLSFADCLDHWIALHHARLSD